MIEFLVAVALPSGWQLLVAFALIELAFVRSDAKQLPLGKRPTQQFLRVQLFNHGWSCGSVLELLRCISVE